MNENIDSSHEHLPRLERGYYRGQAYVHWISTIDDRRSGWLSPSFYYKFREILTHAAFRYAIACPIFCLMPDHIHMVWIGIDEQSDQCNAMKFWRKQMGDVLKKIGFHFQHQPYDHVLRNDERLEQAFENLVEYIARNPERKGLVPVDEFKAYKYSGCLMPGYPEFDFRQADYWLRFWRCYSYLCKNGLFRPFATEDKENVDEVTDGRKPH